MSVTTKLYVFILFSLTPSPRDIIGILTSPTRKLRYTEVKQFTLIANLRSSLAKSESSVQVDQSRVQAVSCYATLLPNYEGESENRGKGRRIYAACQKSFTFY